MSAYSVNRAGDAFKVGPGARTIGHERRTSARTGRRSGPVEQHVDDPPEEGLVPVERPPSRRAALREDPVQAHADHYPAGDAGGQRAEATQPGLRLEVL